MPYRTDPKQDETPSSIAFATPDITSEEIDAVVRVLKSGWLTTGEECFELERELQTYLSAPHVVTMASCTAALETAFAWLGLPTNARVGVPTWTFVSSALAPMRYGARPVLLDVTEATLNLSPRALEKALADGLDAVVAVHFGGVPVDPEIYELCADANVPVVEDAAHALGATDHRGHMSGQGSVAACLSFYATKNLTSAEGGALVTHNDALADFARAYRLHGLSKDAWARYEPGQTAGYDLIAPGIKGNLPDLLAALARSQLRRFDDMQRTRRRLVKRYRQRVADIAGVHLLPALPVAGSADHLVVISLPEGVDRGRVVDSLTETRVATSVHFQPLHTFPMMAKSCELAGGGYPVATRLAERVLSLPLHPGMTEADVDQVCDALATAVRAGR